MLVKTVAIVLLTMSSAVLSAQAELLKPPRVGKNVSGAIRPAPPQATRPNTSAEKAANRNAEEVDRSARRARWDQQQKVRQDKDWMSRYIRLRKATGAPL